MQAVIQRASALRLSKGDLLRRPCYCQKTDRGCFIRRLIGAVRALGARLSGGYFMFVNKRRNRVVTVNSKTGEGDRCIYTQPFGLCDGSQPLHSKEHYLPAGLGNFRNDVRLRDYICNRCQKDLGSLEDVFMHNGAEAFFRRMVGVKGRKRNQKKNIFYQRTAGMAPLTVIAPQPGQDYTALFEIDGSEGHAMKQLVFRDEQNNDLHLPFIPGQLAADLACFRAEHKGKRLWLISYIYDNANPAEEQEIELLCQDFLKGKRSESIIPEGGDQIEAEMRAAVSIPYLRAIAKIAFHFVLAHFPFTGLEPEFDDIKTFIFTGVSATETREPHQGHVPQQCEDHASSQPVSLNTAD
jgi:hypothetical protein